MKACQKQLLLGLGLVDILVMGLLGSVIWRHRPRTSLPAQPSFAPCEQMLLARLPGYLSPAVSWKTEQLYVMFVAQYASADPPASSAQLLWEALDGLAAVGRRGCLFPADVTVVVTAQGQESTLGHLARLRGTDVTAWRTGEISAEQLAARAGYRLIGGATPLALQPGPWHYPR
ncbi:MAG: hypothetical protein U9Q70_06705 [Chloroflexota bacterium]|nr:hypothetical protein [Chloroflexota bacterium]